MDKGASCADGRVSVFTATQITSIGDLDFITVRKHDALPSKGSHHCKAPLESKAGVMPISL